MGHFDRRFEDGIRGTARVVASSETGVPTDAGFEAGKARIHAS